MFVVLTMEGVEFRTRRYVDVQMFDLQYLDHWEALQVCILQEIQSLPCLL